MNKLSPNLMFSLPEGSLTEKIMEMIQIIKE